jgi:hypothetical protein
VLSEPRLTRGSRCIFPAELKARVSCRPVTLASPRSASAKGALGIPAWSTSTSNLVWPALTKIFVRLDGDGILTILVVGHPEVLVGGFVVIGVGQSLRVTGSSPWEVLRTPAGRKLAGFAGEFPPMDRARPR